MDYRTDILVEAALDEAFANDSTTVTVRPFANDSTTVTVRTFTNATRTW